MKSVLVVLSLLAVNAMATEIVKEGKSQEVRTFTKPVTLQTKCEVVPGSYDRETGEYHEAFCSCVKAHAEMEKVLAHSYPTMTRNGLPGPAWVTCPMDMCGTNITVNTTVTYTQSRDY